MELRALSVSEISLYVTRVFEAEEMLHDIKIFGEISTFQIKNGELRIENCFLGLLAD